MHPFRRPVLLRLSLLALVAASAACEESKTVAPDDAITLEVTPSGTVELTTGDTLRLRVAVGNASDPAATFRSSAASVATVTEGGLITAVGPGTATIVIASAVDPARQQGVLVHVSAPAPPAPGGGAAAIAISGVLDAASREPLDRAAIEGRVLLSFDFQRGRASRLEVLAGDSLVCSQSFAAASGSAAAGPSRATAAVPFECVVETARFDAASGAVSFPNGPLAVTARLLGPADTVRAADQVMLGLANRDTLLARIAVPRQATDAGGLVWVDGPVTVTAIPVRFGSSSGPARVVFAYRNAGGDTLSVVDTSSPFRVVLSDTLAPSAGGLAGVTDAELRVTASTTLASGEAGPAASTPSVRYDNQAPTPGGLLGREWVGAATRFATLYESSAQSDQGVGGIAVRFFAGIPSLPADRIVQSGTPVEVGADLPEAAVGTYRFAARVCDALDNCRVLEGFTFGVDRGAPVIGSASLADRAVNPAQDLTVAVSDNRSGFGPRFLQASVTLLDADPATSACGPLVEGTDLPGRSVGSGCVPDTVGALPTPRSTAGYYTYRVAPLDQALNLGEAITRTILVDLTAPSIESVAVPASPAAGRDFAVGAVASDNLDLFTVSAALVFPRRDGSRLALPFAAADSADAPFDAELATRFSASVSLPFVVSLTEPEAGALAARSFAVDSLRITATDVAGLTARQSRPLQATAPVVNPFLAVDLAYSALTLQNVCALRCLGTDPTTTVLTARLVGPVGFRNPFEGGRVYFFANDASGGVFLLGSASGASVSDTGNRRVISISLTVRPPAGLVGDFTLFAVGVNAAGNGLRIGDSPLRLFGR